MVSVAQLVEARIVIPVVAGSSPVVHPSNKAVKRPSTALCPAPILKRFVSDKISNIPSLI